MLSALGRFTVRIDGSAECIDRLSADWQAYAVPSGSCRPDAIVRLVCEPQLSCTAAPEGWNTVEYGGQSLAACVLNGQMAFALAPDDAPGYVTALLPRMRYRAIQLATHYGLLLALRRDCIGLHGVTLLCGDEVVILSAPSGTGKTTLAKLLETWGDASVINGDFAMLSAGEEGVMFEPTPFCGTSCRCVNARVRVNRIVFLEQALKDRWQPLTARQALLRLLSNAFIPTWNASLGSDVQEVALRCASRVRFDLFSFAPERGAAELFLKMLSHEVQASSE